MINKIEGLDELINALATFGDDAKREIAPTVDSVSVDVLTSVKSKVNNKTGQLSNSLHIKKEKSKSKYRLVNYVTWGDDVREYAAALELGHHLVFFGKDTTKRVQPHSFMRAGADAVADAVVKKMVVAMDDALNKLGGLK